MLKKVLEEWQVILKMTMKAKKILMEGYTMLDEPSEHLKQSI